MWWIIGIIAFVLIIIMYIISTYNRLVTLRNRVRDQWAQIDVQLKRRFDLIPNVVNTVKGYAKHESETLENVIKARNTFMSASSKEDEMKADGELTNAISKLFALTESYPELKANENFIKLQDELKETENKIASSRQFYNDTVLNYNNRIELFPSNIVAGLFHFKRESFFEANAKERENVKVEF
jgi:LemA protein